MAPNRSTNLSSLLTSDGKVDLGEIEALLHRSCHKEMEDANIGAAATRMLAYADLNHDGLISREEYDALVRDVEYLIEGN